MTEDKKTEFTRDDLERVLGIHILDAQWEWVQTHFNNQTDGPKPDAVYAYQEGIRAEQDRRASRNAQVWNTEE